MKIIKHGDLERLKQVKHFICSKCGCEVEADNTEYKYGRQGCYIKCPDCNNIVWADD